MAASDTAASWSRSDERWRDPAQVISHWEAAGEVEPALLRHRVRGSFWDVLDESGATLLVSREYEHLLMALSIRDSRPHITLMALPHPSGIAADRNANSVFVASTRNPNQVFELAPARFGERGDAGPEPDTLEFPLLPVRSMFLPGSLYIHDLAFVGRRLHANAVGHNAVVRIDDGGRWHHAWWPRAIERDGEPEFGINHLQVNSIASGRSLADSFFSASTDEMSSRRPGHLNFPVDGRGVIFSGRTREPVVGGLTRPHSARLHGGRLWVANSGYGQLAYAAGRRATAFAQLPGWTRGLCFVGNIAFVGTSRVIPRFRAYAPGLAVDQSVCGVHAVDLTSGAIVGSISWPGGNQIFALDWLPRTETLGLPFGGAPKRTRSSARKLFYTFETHTAKAREKTT